MDANDYLSEYNPQWSDWFAEIAQYLRQKAGGSLRIEHVGSTSVVGVVAKPIIDIDIVVAPGRMAEVIDSLTRAGYLHQGDLGIAGREAFESDSEAVRNLPPHHLYACEEGAFELHKHLSFRDYLRAHPAEAHWLSDLKRKLAFQDRLSRAEYIAAKSSLVQEITSAALAWRDGTLQNPNEKSPLEPGIETQPFLR